MTTADALKYIYRFGTNYRQALHQKKRTVRSGHVFAAAQSQRRYYTITKTRVHTLMYYTLRTYNFCAVQCGSAVGTGTAVAHQVAQGGQTALYQHGTHLRNPFQAVHQEYATPKVFLHQLAVHEWVEEEVLCQHEAVLSQVLHDCAVR